MAGSVAASTAPMSRATGKATPNTGQTTSATITAVMSTPGRTSKAEADGRTGDHAQGDAGSAVEQDEGHPDVEEELGPDPVEGILDDARAPKARSGPPPRRARPSRGAL